MNEKISYYNYYLFIWLEKKSVLVQQSISLILDLPLEHVKPDHTLTPPVLSWGLLVFDSLIKVSFGRLHW